MCVPFPATDDGYDVRKTYSQFQTAEDVKRWVSRLQFITSLSEGGGGIQPVPHPVNTKNTDFLYYFVKGGKTGVFNLSKNKKSRVREHPAFMRR
jgi:hypothetical protein